MSSAIIRYSTIRGESGIKKPSRSTTPKNILRVSMAPGGIKRKPANSRSSFYERKSVARVVVNPRKDTRAENQFAGRSVD